MATDAHKSLVNTKKRKAPTVKLRSTAHPHAFIPNIFADIPKDFNHREESAVSFDERVKKENSQPAKDHREPTETFEELVRRHCEPAKIHYEPTEDKHVPADDYYDPARDFSEPVKSYDPAAYYDGHCINPALIMKNNGNQHDPEPVHPREEIINHPGLTMMNDGMQHYSQPAYPRAGVINNPSLILNNDDMQLDIKPEIGYPTAGGSINPALTVKNNNTVQLDPKQLYPSSEVTMNPGMVLHNVDLTMDPEVVFPRAESIINMPQTYFEMFKLAWDLKVYRQSPILGHEFLDIQFDVLICGIPVQKPPHYVIATMMLNEIACEMMRGFFYFVDPPEKHNYKNDIRIVYVDSYWTIEQRNTWRRAYLYMKEDSARLINSQQLARDRPVITIAMPTPADAHPKGGNEERLGSDVQAAYILDHGPADMHGSRPVYFSKKHKYVNPRMPGSDKNKLPSGYSGLCNALLNMCIKPDWHDGWDFFANVHEGTLIVILPVNWKKFHDLAPGPALPHAILDANSLPPRDGQGAVKHESGHNLA